MNEKNNFPLQEISSIPGNRFSNSMGQDKPGLPTGHAGTKSPRSSSLEMEDIVNRLIVYFKKNLK